jgi:hypothetical protein
MTHAIVHVPAGGLDPENQPAIKQVETLDLKTMQELVGGPIECLSLAEGVDMFFNENGRLIGLPPNRLISNRNGQFDILGDAIIVASTPEGETVGLSIEQGKKWLRFAREAPTAILGLA